uniref:Uncharacterized protein n=1 Tax=Oryza sativa subsp. japonica TaxID=39947 RepID=Q6Z8X9_ORYSJ|nr:hypothetical protein [Oryza sativa Japonica Group]BAD07852.1 hypothetical protein [Oryza sativa Japonica Group]
MAGDERRKPANGGEVDWGSEGRAVSGSAVAERGLRRAHGDAGPEGHRRRTGGGAKRWRKGRHGARARGEAGGHGATRGRSRGSPGAWWREGLTRGEPTAADFDGDRRRRAKGENFTRATGVRFVGAGASTRGRELIPSVERARATPREAGDGERRPGQSKGARRDVTNGGGRGAACDRGKGVQWGAHRREKRCRRRGWSRGEADATAGRRGRGRRDGEARGWGRRGAPRRLLVLASSPTRTTAEEGENDDERRGGSGVMEERKWRCRFGRTDLGAVKEMRRMARAVKRRRGGDAGGGRGKGKRRGKGGWSFAILRRGGAAASPILGRCGVEWRGPWMTSAMTVAVGLAWSGGKAAARGVSGARADGGGDRVASARAGRATGEFKRRRRESAPGRGVRRERERERKETREALLLSLGACSARAGRRRSGREEKMGWKREKRPNDQEGGETAEGGRGVGPEVGRRPLLPRDWMEEAAPRYHVALPRGGSGSRGVRPEVGWRPLLPRDWMEEAALQCHVALPRGGSGPRKGGGHSLAETRGRRPPQAPRGSPRGGIGPEVGRRPSPPRPERSRHAAFNVVCSALNRSVTGRMTDGTQDVRRTIACVRRPRRTPPQFTSEGFHRPPPILHPQRRRPSYRWAAALHPARRQPLFWCVATLHLGRRWSSIEGSAGHRLPLPRCLLFYVQLHYTI